MSRPTGTLWALLGASAVVLVAVAVLSLIAAEGLDRLGGSVSILIGLLGGAALIVAGLTGVFAYGRPAVAAADEPVVAAADDEPVVAAAEDEAAATAVDDEAEAAARRASRRRSSEQWRRLEERAEGLARSADQRPA